MFAPLLFVFSLPFFLAGLVIPALQPHGSLRNRSVLLQLVLTGLWIILGAVFVAPFWWHASGECSNAYFFDQSCAKGSIIIHFAATIVTAAPLSLISGIFVLRGAKRVIRRTAAN